MTAILPFAPHVRVNTHYDRWHRLLGMRSRCSSVKLQKLELGGSACRQPGSLIR